MLVRQTQRLKDSKPSVLGKPTPFSNSPEMRSFQTKQSVNKTNVSDGVNHYTSVSRPQLKSYQVKDKVVPNNSQVKFNHKEVEEHHRISSISRKTKYLNDVNARTKKPKVVPISTSKPKSKANKSVATPNKKTVASDTTIQKSKSYHKELKHMTGNHKLLCNFVEKFLGTVRFGNDQFAPILGYGDLIQGNVMASAENNTSSPVPQGSKDV
ncbi:hypothetical protein Tco_1051249 [Tanacetum coccineum]